MSTPLRTGEAEEEGKRENNKPKTKAEKQTFQENAIAVVAVVAAAVEEEEKEEEEEEEQKEEG